ncbi:XdhC family protein [Cellulosimicrobium funkei]|uniref:XdhC/CoxI family protein n=1 Tax=Cellulosimicrobium funkei TaxID=264251 RepID=A0A4Y8R210_9MICO|nr:XdhC/CoxI family protein [Cellulosimicrobium funkei]TFF11428.1 XdhC/CoxI family protein [Cellulosimicrobium funkei]TGA75181.1 XdhC/CoxI family protein [Cellulosimicrobium terreum]
MLHIVDRLAPWLGPGQPPFAVATVVAASGSVPRPVGTAMAVRADGAVLGSLSGGCVEGAVHAAALDAIASGTSHRETFGYSDDDAFAVGLSCGGTLDVHVQPVLPDDDATRALHALAARAEPAPPVALVRRIDGGARTAVVVDDPGAADEAAVARALRGLVGPDSLAAAAAQVVAVLRAGGTATVHAAHGGPGAAPSPSPSEGCAAAPAPAGAAADACDAAEPVTLLVETRLPAPRFLVCGANDFAGALVRHVRLLGYRVTLVDAREVFADPRRFPEAEVVVEWPDRYLAAEAAAGRLDARTAVAVLTHDAKFDVPLLRLALDLTLAYVGAMGSRRSHAQRVAALRAEGVGEAALARLRSPIGLDLGAVTPEEVAVSITAELVATRHGRSAVVPLSSSSGPLHAEPAARPDGAPTHRPHPEEAP